MTAMIPAIQFSPAKAQLSDVMTSVVHRHQVRLIQRHHGKEEALVMNPSDLLGMLAHATIPTTTHVDEDEFVMSVPAWDLTGVGKTFDEALHDLVDEMRDYVADYIDRMAFYLQTSRREHAPAVFRFALTPPEAHADLLLTDSEAADAPLTPLPAAREPVLAGR